MVVDEFGSSEAGKKGGKARAAKLSREERSEIARIAAQSRWEPKLPTATHGDPDHPIRIGEIEIPCYVLSDGRRVIVQSGMLTGLDMKQGTAGRGAGDRLAKFIATKSVNPHIPKGLSDVIIEPIRFRVASGAIAYGYEATVLADLCDAVLEARSAGKLNYQQEHIADRCEVLVRGFARVGIIALVDEATGYQADRDRDELVKILSAYIDPVLRPYVPKFPPEFFKEIYRLNGWKFNPNSTRRNQQVGIWINKFIYKELPPGVLEELRENKNPRLEGGRRRYKHFQFLTENVGNPHLDRLLASVTMVMRVSDSKSDFEDKFQRAFHPERGVQQRLTFEREDE